MDSMLILKENNEYRMQIEYVHKFDIGKYLNLKTVTEKKYNLLNHSIFKWELWHVFKQVKRQATE